MCGRYTLHKSLSEIAKRFNAPSAASDNAYENYNVAPGQIMPVITEDESGRKIEEMKWGLVPVWAKDPNIGYKLINARDDTIFDKPMWRRVILRKRALVPADGFYEWQRPSDPKKRKQPFYIYPKHEELFAFAGIWDVWRDADGNEWKTYSIVTTEPNREMSRLHNRMPVILYQDDEAAWLDPSREKREEIEPLLHPYEDNGLEMYEVSPDVNSPRNNDAHLIHAVV